MHTKPQQDSSSYGPPSEGEVESRRFDVTEDSQQAEAPVSRVDAILPPPPRLPPSFSIQPPALTDDEGSESDPLALYGPPSIGRRRLTEPPPPSTRRRSTISPPRPLPSVLPSGPESEDVQSVIDAEPSTERAPLSSWRPKQKYPSYIPPAERPPESVPGRAFAIKVLDSPVELASSYRLRYQVYETLDYLQHKSPAKLELDPFDQYAIPFGAIEIQTGELVGTLRLITNCVQMFYARRINQILEVAGDPLLRALALRRKKRAMPSMVSDAVEQLIDAYNTDDRPVEEVSRAVVHPKYRGSGVSRALMEFGLAYAMAGGDPLILGGCLPEHLPMYGKYGFQQLPGAGLDLFENVRRIAHTIICDTRSLPEPTGTRVSMILQAMRMGELECLLEECGLELGGKKVKCVWHFNETYCSQAANIESMLVGAARSVAV
jgi:GNAT superfamily N-acetyltransferase